MRHTPTVPLSPQLELIATAAADRLRAETGGDPCTAAELRRRLVEAASDALRAGTALGEVADAERVGEARMRQELRPELLRRVERAARRKREADHEHDQAVTCAARAGLSHREIAQRAEITHGTIKTILERAAAAESHPVTSNNGDSPQPSERG